MSQKYIQIYRVCPSASQNGKSVFKKDTVKFFLFAFFLQSTHQVGMKNVVKCYKDFFWLFQCSKNPLCGGLFLRSNTSEELEWKEKK